jgi:hypothetical protein
MGKSVPSSDTDPMALLRLKLKRANERVNALDRALARSSDRHPAKIRTKLDKESGWHTSDVSEAKLPTEGRFALWAGESLYHGRSVLDHLVWALVKANGQTPGHHNEFPVLDRCPQTAKRESTRDAFLRDMLKEADPSNPKSRPGKLRGIDPDAAALIECLQPYNRGSKPTDYLTVLHKMARDDRHHELHTSQVIMGKPDHLGLRLEVPEGVTIVDREPLFKPGDRLEVGTKLERFRLSEWGAHPDPKMRVEVDVPAPIAFGDPPVTLDGLMEINRLLGERLRLFEEFL